MLFLIFLPMIIAVLIMAICTYVAFFKKTFISPAIIVIAWLSGLIPVLLSYSSMSSSSSSTAGLAVLGFPMLFVMGAVIGAVVGFGVNLFVKSWIKKDWINFSLSLFIVIPAIYFIVLKTIEKFQLEQVSNLQGAATTEFTNGKNRADLKIQEILAIVKNPNASSESLEKIAEIDDPLLHERAEYNFTIEDKATMSYIADHPNVNEKTLKILAKSPSVFVRQHVALNKKTPTDVILELAKEITPEKLSSSNTDPVVMSLLRNNKIPSELLEKYYTSIVLRKDNYHYLSSLLANSNLPEKILYENAVSLMKQFKSDSPDRSYNLLVNIAANPILKGKALNLLAEEKKFQFYLLKNPNLTEAHLEKMAQSKDGPLGEAAARILEKRKLAK